MVAHQVFRRSVWNSAGGLVRDSKGRGLRSQRAQQGPKGETAGFGRLSSSSIEGASDGPIIEEPLFGSSCKSPRLPMQSAISGAFRMHSSPLHPGCGDPRRIVRCFLEAPSQALVLPPGADLDIHVT